MGGKIIAIGNGLAAGAEAYDAGRRLACGGLIETHIHLDKSRIRPIPSSSMPKRRNRPWPRSVSRSRSSGAGNGRSSASRQNSFGQPDCMRLICPDGHVIHGAAARAVCFDRGDALSLTNTGGNDELANAANIVGVAAPGGAVHGGGEVASRITLNLICGISDSSRLVRKSSRR